MSDVTVSEVARRVDVSPGTLRRWVRDASASGRLAYSYMEQLFPPEAGTRTLEFQRIGEVKLKGFDEATELHLARRAAPNADPAGRG
jgi:transposase-like protein